MKRIYLLLLIICITSSSCNLAYRVLLGIDTSPEWKTDKEIEKDFRKKNIAEANRFVLDTASYDNTVKADLKKTVIELRKDSASYDTVHVKNLLKIANDDLQSVQIRYFTKNGDPIFKLVNCYIDPPIPMSWNVENSFDVFPPKNDIPLLQYNRPISYFFPHITTLQGEPLNFSSLPEADYYAIVYWNSFLKRPSNKLIKTLKRYNKKHTDKKTHFIFVNNQNAAIWSATTQEQKQELMKQLKEEEEKKKK